MTNEKPGKLKKIRKEAIDRIAKTEQLQIRLDATLWDCLFKLATRRRQPVSAMVREWIIERANAEAGGKPNVQNQLDQITDKLEFIAQEEKRVCALLAELNRKLD
jgi:hypothetical protein